MSYGPNFLDLFRRSTDYVDKILRGAKPTDIPGRAIDQVGSRHKPGRSVELPPTLLARADEVIE